MATILMPPTAEELAQSANAVQFFTYVQSADEAEIGRMTDKDLFRLSGVNTSPVWLKVWQKQIGLSQAGLLMYLLLDYWEPCTGQFQPMNYSEIASDLGMTPSGIGAAIKKLVDAEILAPCTLNFGSGDDGPGYRLHPSIYDWIGTEGF